MRKRFVPFLFIAILLSAGVSFFLLRVFQIPDAASVQRGYMDPALKLLLLIAAVIFIWVVTALAYVVIFQRPKHGDNNDGPPVTGNLKLEWAWSVIPLLVVVGVAFYGGFVLQDMERAPTSNMLNVEVTAFRWGWKFYYPDYGITSLYLELEANRPVELHMTSLDVVHSFWVQEFGPKQDIVPGMMMHLDITPDKIGNYTLVCDQLCGAGHTGMTAPVYVVSSGDFQTWVQQHQTNVTTPPTTTTSTAGELAAQGQSVFSASCARCHGDAGQGSSAPALIGKGANLSKYSTAQTLLNFMSSAMPFDAPGSLTHQQYLELLSYLLVQNSYVQSASIFDENQLGSVALK